MLQTPSISGVRAVDPLASLPRSILQHRIETETHRGPDIGGCLSKPRAYDERVLFRRAMARGLVIRTPVAVSSSVPFGSYVGNGSMASPASWVMVDPPTQRDDIPPRMNDEIFPRCAASVTSRPGCWSPRASNHPEFIRTAITQPMINHTTLVLLSVRCPFSAVRSVRSCPFLSPRPRGKRGRSPSRAVAHAIPAGHSPLNSASITRGSGSLPVNTTAGRIER
jgi:hypothetical protein